MYNINTISTESTLRKICDSLIGPSAQSSKENAVRITFDLRIRIQKGNYDQRDIAIGIHFLKYGYKVLGCADDHFLGTRDLKSKNWKLVSNHDSCWADSFMGFLRRVVCSVMTEQHDHELVKGRYDDDELVFDEDNYDIAFFSIESMNIVPVKNLVGIVYEDRDFQYNNNTSELIDSYRKKMLEELGIDV